MKKDNKAQGKKPFFARLLETQELETVAGGATITYPHIDTPDTNITYPHIDTPDQTTKYPSDRDETELL